MTLLELMVVVLIIGILVATALPSFTKSKESSLNKEANLTLKLIQAAERVYYIENDIYTTCNATVDVNRELKLYIPNSNSRNWDYKVSAASSNFTAKAKRQADDGRAFCINQSSDDPYSTGCTW